MSTGHPAITAGTIGARVTDGTDVFALSNNHVYADVNAASIGDAVIQPGTFDDGSSPDAATAATVGNATPGDGTPKSATVAASVNQKVKKYGRTTGLSKGQVYVINATVNVCYEADAAGNCTKLASFVDQIVITPGSFSAGGDSGSLIVADGKGRNKADDRKPVGLLFAGGALVTIANPIDAVLAAFNVTIDGDQRLSAIRCLEGERARALSPCLMGKGAGVRHQYRVSSSVVASRVLLPAVWAILLLAVTAACGERGPGEKPGEPVESTMTIEEVLREQAASLMSLTGVVAVGQGECSGTPCIRILVAEKTTDLMSQIPSAIDGYEVEVHESGEIKALEPG